MSCEFIDSSIFRPGISGIWRLFFRSAFLAASDQARADKLCCRKVESVVVPYYNPSYLRRSNLSSGRAFDSTMVRVQIGNDASAVNDHRACLAELSRVRKLAFTLVYPLGYGRFDAQYIEHLKTTSQRSFAVQCEFIDHLLPPDQFDMLIDSCDALLLASRDQRALYSIYRYLAAGKPVFLPKDAELRRDLQDLAFQVEALESLGTMNASMFSDLAGGDARPMCAWRANVSAWRQSGERGQRSSLRLDPESYDQLCQEVLQRDSWRC